MDNSKPERPPESTACDPAGFSKFFAAYPRQVDQAQALRAWVRLNPDSELQDEIARAVTAWIRSPEWQREGGRFIPKPGNWLTHQRWRDVPGVSTPPLLAPEVHPRAAPMTPEELAINRDRALTVAAKARAVFQGGVSFKTARMLPRSDAATVEQR